MGVNELIKVGKNIKSIRKNKKLSQKKVADMLNIPYSTYSNYENDNREPNKEILTKIATALDVNINDLLFKEFDSEESISDKKSVNTLYDSKINPEIIDVFTKLISLCGYEVSLNEFNEDDTEIQNYLFSEINNGKIPYIYIYNKNSQVNMSNAQFQNFMNRILKFINSQIIYEQN